MPHSPPTLRPRVGLAKIVAAALIASALASPAFSVAAESPTPIAPGLRLVGAPTTSPAITSPHVSPVATPTVPPVGVLRRVGDAPPDSSLAGVAARVAATPTGTARPTAAPQPTDTPTPTPTPIELPRFDPAKDAVRGHVEGNQLVLEVPIRSQFDGTEFQASNCGPTSLAMVLDAFGVASKTFQVRNLVNVLANNFDVEAGTSLDALSWIANQAGLRVIGLYADSGYRKWTVDDVREEVRHGHPVITLVKYRDLPKANLSQAEVDHYVVVVGLEGADLLINDPAMPADLGYRLPLTTDELKKAWADSSIPGQAVAYAATENVRELNLPDPASPSASPAPAVRLGDGERDDWRLPGGLAVPELAAATPTATAVMPTATTVAPAATEAAAAPTPSPSPTSEPRATPTASPVMSPWTKATQSVDPERGDTPAPMVPSRRGDLGLLSLLSLPLFFLRSVVRFPG